MTASGRSLSQIGARLYAEKYPTPAEYKRNNDPKCIWHKGTVLDILHDEQYIGTYIAGKTKKLDIGGKQIKTDEYEWIRIPGHHPAIIDSMVFETAQTQINRRGEPLRKRKTGTWERYKHIRSSLQGKVICGCCGHTMKLSSTKNAAFHCDFSRAAPDVECYRLKMLARELEVIVLEKMHSQSRIILGGADDCAAQLDHSARATQIESAKRVLYERLVLGELTADEYKAEKADLDTELERLKFTRKEITKKTMDSEMRKVAEDALITETLTCELADALIEKVKVHPGGKAEIAWRV